MVIAGIVAGGTGILCAGIGAVLHIQKRITPTGYSHALFLSPVS